MSTIAVYYRPAGKDANFLLNKKGDTLSLIIVMAIPLRCRNLGEDALPLPDVDAGYEEKS
jgi:hypothetical protein